MQKTKEELEEIRKKYEQLNSKFIDLNNDELSNVTGGSSNSTGVKYPNGTRIRVTFGELAGECGVVKGYTISNDLSNTVVYFCVLDCYFSTTVFMLAENQIEPE